MRGEETVRVNRRDLHKLLDDNAHLKDQVDSLQAKLNEQLEERRGVRYQVTEFHHAMNQPVLHTPAIPPQARVRLRLKLVAEEFFELARAAGVRCTAAENVFADCLEQTEFFEVDLPELVDAMADLDYVVEGTRLECGVNGWPVAQEVHRTNMAKLDGSRDDDGKILKPEGWEPPDIGGVLREQGWLGD